VIAPANSSTVNRLPHSLARPQTVNRRKVRWAYAIGVLGMHGLALLALLPSLFYWTSVAAALCGIYVFGTLGINLCYHRLLTHRGYQCPKWLEHGLALIGVCSLQDTPARWVATHRMHHQYSDQQPDPHSPLVNFFWGHMEWLLVENRDLASLSLLERYSKDLVSDRFYRRLERGLNWLWVNLMHWGIFFLVGFLGGTLSTGRLAEGLRFGTSLVVWGVFVRTVIVWHITWSVNSVTHLWGYRTYDTAEGSRNNIFIGILSNGEGWHNNHHAEPRAASPGHMWWEFDVTYLTLRFLKLVGLAWDIVLPEKRGRHSVHTQRSKRDGRRSDRPNGASPDRLVASGQTQDQPVP
jgi:fatty-acid desaturase